MSWATGLVVPVELFFFFFLMLSFFTLLPAVVIQRVNFEIFVDPVHGYVIVCMAISWFGLRQRLCMLLTF